MKIAALQMVSAPDLAANLATAERLIDQAAADGAQLVSLPEYFVQMVFHETDKFQIAEEFGRGPKQELLAAKAQQHAIWVAGGSIPLKTQDPAKVTNTALLFNPQGEVVARCDKMHLFSYQDGSRNLDEGRTMVLGERSLRLMRLGGALACPFAMTCVSRSFTVRRARRT
jgi:predicted amidohydrolase